MQFILTSDWDDGVADLAHRLIKELSNGKRVLWLVSGGSNTRATCKIMDLVQDGLCRNLTIAPADERFGPEGHSDSNWTQLLQAGLDTKQASVVKVLEGGDSLSSTVNRYQESMKAAFDDNDLVIAQLGIGADGHTAGILPGSPAAYETEELVTSYKSEPFTRLTLTFPALRRINVAYAFAFGESKLEALTGLKQASQPLQEQPAQILNELPEAYLYNDQIGGAS
jgi:6-phosphogluconolactonase/glucosamine-6-phosphate isomerase/deaminase